MVQGQRTALADLLRAYLSTLGSKATPEVQQELTRFVRWCGWDRPAEELTPPEVEDYATTLTAPGLEANHRLEALRGFLTFAYRQGALKQNLARHLRVRNARARRPGEKAQATPLPQVNLTPEGYARLQARLEMLHQEMRRLSQEIRRAAADKDVRENAPLEAAREQQGHIASQIRVLEATLKSARVLKPEQGQEAGGRVRLGSRVHLLDLVRGREVVYHLVDPREADPLKGQLSTASPVGKALMDRAEGEEVEVKAPRGTLRYRILRVE